MKLICPKCGGKMKITKKPPQVFVPDTFTYKMDDLLITKMWICNTKWRDHPYYVLEDMRKLQVGGLSLTS